MSRASVDDVGSGHRSLRQVATSVANVFSLSVGYTVADVRRRPRNFCIGLTSIIIVVFFVGLILSATSKTPLILLRFAELNVGEMDALILAEGSLPFLNYTNVQPRIDAAPEVSGSAPRWLLKGQVRNLATVQENRRRATVGDPPLPVPTLSTNILVVDSEKEKRVGIGRAWPYREIGFSEAQVYHSALRFIGVGANVGARAQLFIDVASILEQQGIDVTLPAPFGDAAAATLIDPNATIPIGLGFANLSITGQQLLDFASEVQVLGAGGGANTTGVTLLDLLNASIPSVDVTSLLVPEARLIVADAVRNTAGKYPATLGNMVILDYRTLVEMLLEQSCLANSGDGLVGALNPLPGIISPLVENVNLQDYVLAAVAMFRRRFEIYYSEASEMKRDMIRVSNDLLLALGIDFAGSMQYPLAIALSEFQFLQIFLDSVFFSVVAVIMVLGALLVYTLLLTNAEERSFEVAMVRAQGMPKTQLLHLMLTQALAFIIPGSLIAIALLYGVNAIVELALASLTEAPARTTRLPGHAVGVALGMGFVVPLLANWGPIKSAMSHSLRDALDVYRQASNEVKVTMLKLAELGLEPWQTLMGWFLTIAGFLIYYMIPFSFTFNELWLFFLILNLILLTMLFGLCMISYSLQEPLERAALWLILWGPDRRLHTLISRNLASHRDRNSKSFMMFACSIACIVFGGVLFTLLAGSLSNTLKLFNGSDVTVTSLDFDFPLNRSVIDSFLLTQGAVVASWSYLTFPSRDYPQFTSVERTSNILGFPRRWVRFVGVDERYLETVFPEFVSFAEVDESFSYEQTSTGIKDVVKSMYSDPPAATLDPAGRIFTGFPPNVTVPDVDAKYRFVVPCLMAAAATELMGINSRSFATMRLTYTTGSEVTLRVRRSQFLLRPRAMLNRISGWPGVSTQRFGFGQGAVFIPLSDFARALAPADIDFAGETGSQFQMSPNTITEVNYQKLFVRLRGNVSEADRTDFVNFLQSQVNPYYHQPLDTQEIINAIQLMSDLIIYFFFFISVVVIILDTFMLWLAFVSNVKLNAWGFGVLRALGFTVKQLIRGYVYEAMALVMSSFFVGTIIGILVALTLILQMNLFLQLPFTFAFPWELFLFILGMSLLSATAGSIIPSLDIAKRSISGVLKGN